MQMSVTPSSHYCSILIVDDSRMNRLILREQMVGLGHECSDAVDGEEALRMIQEGKFDIVLLDVEMPKMRGPELLAKLKESGLLQSLSVIMISGMNETAMVASCLEAGADDYFTKPIEPTLLRARVNSCVQRKALREREINYFREMEEVNGRLKETNQQLTELNKEKNEFLGIATHDLKNPLVAILAHVSLIQSDPENVSVEEVLSTLAVIEQSCHRMQNIIVNLLDVNRIESGNFTIHLQPVDLTASVRQVYQRYLPQAEKKQIRILLEDSFDQSVMIMADQGPLDQVLDNLVSNAIKYSPKGNIVTIQLRHGESRARVSVQDQGPGLTELELKKLFGKFVRLGPKPTGGEHSTGLGLSIVKRLVEMMNGQVWCESEPGEGSRFILEMRKSDVAL